jgi:hypothetical protein
VLRASAPPRLLQFLDALMNDGRGRLPHVTKGFVSSRISTDSIWKERRSTINEERFAERLATALKSAPGMF